MTSNDLTFNANIFDKIMKNIVYYNNLVYYNNSGVFLKNIKSNNNYKNKIYEVEKHSEISYLYPEIESFKIFLNKYNINLKTYEVKIQIYIIILFYIYFADSIGYDIYLYILEIQCVLFYKKIEKQKCFGKLREKKELLYFIKEIVRSLLRKFFRLKKEEKQKEEYGILNTLKYEKIKTQFIIFLEDNNVDLSILQKIPNHLIIIIIILFYSEFIIKYDNWYLIWINEKYEPNNYLYPDLKNQEFQIDSLFFDCIMNNNNNRSGVEGLKAIIKNDSNIIKLTNKHSKVINLMKAFEINFDDKFKLIDYFYISSDVDSFKKCIEHIISDMNVNQNISMSNIFQINHHRNEKINELIKKYNITLKRNTNTYIYIIILLYLYLSFDEHYINVYYFIIAVQKIFIYDEQEKYNYTIADKKIISESLNILIFILIVISTKNIEKNSNIIINKNEIKYTLFEPEMFEIKKLFKTKQIDNELDNIPRDYELIIIILMYMKCMISKFNWPLINVDYNFKPANFLSGKYALEYGKSFQYEIKIFDDYKNKFTEYFLKNIVKYVKNKKTNNENNHDSEIKLNNSKKYQKNINKRIDKINQNYKNISKNCINNNNLSNIALNNPKNFNKNNQNIEKQNNTKEKKNPK